MEDLDVARQPLNKSTKNLKGQHTHVSQPGVSVILFMILSITISRFVRIRLRSHVSCIQSHMVRRHTQHDNMFLAQLRIYVERLVHCDTYLDHPKGNDISQQQGQQHGLQQRLQAEYLQHQELG